MYARLKLRDLFLLTCCLLPVTTLAADRETVDAAIGGGIGGAVGGAVGEELAGRKGAIVGAAAGAAIGAAITTEDESARRSTAPAPVVVIETHSGHPPAHGRHCPPGQAKKGRC